MKTKLTIVAIIALAVGFGAAQFIRLPELRAQQPRKMIWEYKVVFTSAQDSDGAKDLTDQYNTLAADGWEYVGPIVDKTEKSGSAADQKYVGIRGTFTLFKRAKA